VLGIGGGSVIDAAKGVALLAANGGSILDYEGIDRIEHPIPPLIMLPSTSGTGADVSQFCIVTDTERHTKITIMGRALVPDVSVIDPRLLTTMPEALNAATGLDALTHGIEAFVSLAHGPLTDHTRCRPSRSCRPTWSARCCVRTTPPPAARWRRPPWRRAWRSPTRSSARRTR
jgi:alcohol dehydrogenase class IV